MTVGLVLLTVGALGAFGARHEVAATALVVSGSAMFIAALYGFFPSRVKLGENELEWFRDFGETVAEVVDDIPSEVHVPALDNLEALVRSAPERVPDPVRTALRRRDAARELRHFVLSWLPEDVFLRNPTEFDRTDRPLVLTDVLGARVAAHPVALDGLEDSEQMEVVVSALRGMAALSDEDEVDNAILVLDAAASNMCDEAWDAISAADPTYVFAQDGGYEPAAFYVRNEVECAFRSAHKRMSTSASTG